MPWVSTWRLPPPANTTVLVKTGASLNFCARMVSIVLGERWEDRAGNRIPAPDLWLSSDPEAATKEAQSTAAPPPREEPVKGSRRKRAQLAFNFADSVPLPKVTHGLPL